MSRRARCRRHDITKNICPKKEAQTWPFVHIVVIDQIWSIHREGEKKK